MTDATNRRPCLLQQMERAMQLDPDGAAVSSRPAWPTPASASVLRAAASAYGRLGDMPRAVVCRDFADRFEVAGDRGDEDAWTDFVRQCADWEPIDADQLDFILEKEGAWRFAHTNTSANTNAPITGRRPDTSTAAWAASASPTALTAASSPSPSPSQPASGSVSASSISSLRPASRPFAPSMEEIDSLVFAFRHHPHAPMPLQPVEPEPPSHANRE